MGDFFRVTEDLIQIELKVFPGSPKNEFTGIRDKRLCVRIASAPEDGKANACLLGFLAKEFGCAKKDAVIVRGEKSKLKTVTVPAACYEKLVKAFLTAGTPAPQGQSPRSL